MQVHGVMGKPVSYWLCRCQPSYMFASQQQLCSRPNDWPQTTQAPHLSATSLQNAFPMAGFEPLPSHDTSPAAAAARLGLGNLDSSAAMPASGQAAAKPAQSAFASDASACTAAILTAVNSEESAATMLRNSSLTLSRGLSAMLELLYNSDIRNNISNSNADDFLHVSTWTGLFICVDPMSSAILYMQS